jgi:predicted phosphodiesterase
MKVIAHDLGDFDEIFLLPLADWHIGDPHSDGERIKEYLDYLQRTPNAFAILNGDLMNTAVRTGISDIYGETIPPMEALKQCVKLFDPIKEKCLAIMPGNHELRIFKNDGIDTTQLMATQLGIGERYSPTAAYLYIRFGKLTGRCHHGEQVCYTIYAAHGSGGGRTEGAKVNRLLQLASICDADIYIHSHTHLPAITKTAYFRPWPTRSSVQKVDRLFVNTAAALNYGGYGELASFKPASLDTPIIKLDGRKKKATAWL